MKRMRTLVKGEVVRLTPDGPRYTVISVMPCAAYLKGGNVRTVTIKKWDKKRGEEVEQTFEAQGTKIIPVSPNAFVYREEGSK